MSNFNSNLLSTGTSSSQSGALAGAAGHDKSRGSNLISNSSRTKNKVRTLTLDFENVIIVTGTLLIWVNFLRYEWPM